MSAADKEKFDEMLKAEKKRQQKAAEINALASKRLNDKTFKAQASSEQHGITKFLYLLLLSSPWVSS